MAAKTTGLFRRGGAYYVRVVLPQNHPLRQLHRSGRIVRVIGACSHREASSRALVARAELLGATVEPAEIASPASPSLPHPGTSHLQALTLSDVYSRWAKAKRRSDDTLAACKRALKLYQQQTGDLPITTVTRAQGDAFRAWLLAQPTSSKTARDRFTWVKSLLKFAQQDLGLLHASPWAGLDIVARASTRRRPWSDAELDKLFGHEIWREGQLPREPKAGGIAAYWLPLLALYTGARCGELCQLRVADVIQDAEVPCFRITDEGDGQRVKSEAGHRVIPVHSSLIKLGFLDYLASQSGTSLWPELHLRETKPGSYFSTFFTALRRTLGIAPEVVFHSFRHNVRTQMADAGIAESTIDRLLGHRVAGSVGARVYTHTSTKRIKEAIESISYSFHVNRNHATCRTPPKDMKDSHDRP